MLFITRFMFQNTHFLNSFYICEQDMLKCIPISFWTEEFHTELLLPFRNKMHLNEKFLNSWWGTDKVEYFEKFMCGWLITEFYEILKTIKIWIKMMRWQFWDYWMSYVSLIVKFRRFFGCGKGNRVENSTFL